LLGVWLLCVISPGPDFLVTVQYATSRSRRHGMMVALGVSSAILIWATASMLGLAVLLARLSWLYDIVRYVGAAYLLYLGIRTLWSARRWNAGGARLRQNPAPAALPRGPETPAEQALPAAPETSLGRAWRVGFLCNLSNPKAAAFFGSLLGTMMPAHAGVGLRVTAVSMIVAIVLTWYLLLASLFGLAPVARGYRRARRWIDRLMAAVLIAFGGRLALER
jgi:threonine/homoserine/homoserine lactone efflux protein